MSDVSGKNRKTFYLPDGLLPVYDYVIREGAKENRSASEVIQYAMQSLALLRVAQLRMTNGVFFALRDGRFDLIQHSFADGCAVLTLTRAGDVFYHDNIEYCRALFSGNVTDKHLSNNVSLPCSGTELINVFDFKDALIRAFENDCVCSLSTYEEKLRQCGTEDMIRANLSVFDKYVVYVDDAHSYYRHHPQGSIVKDNTIRKNDDGFYVSVDSVYDEFPSVAFHIVENNNEPVGFDITSKSDMSMVAFSYRKNAQLATKTRISLS